MALFAIMRKFPDVSTLKRIAIVRCCGLGDVAQMTPLLRQIRFDAPQARVEVFLNANVAALLEGSPWVDVVHSLPMESFTSSSSNRFFWRLWRAVRSAGTFDVLLCLDLAWSRTVLALLARTWHRVGLRTEAWKPFMGLDFAIPVPLDYPRNADHTSLWFLRTWLAVSGLPDQGFSADLSHLEAAGAAPLVKHIALVPRAGNELVSGDLKQWPLSYWPRLAQRLLEQGWKPVVLGRAGDFDMKTMPEGTLDLQGQLSLKEVAAYLYRCDGLIGNDSGLYHMALAMGTPAVGLFGPTAVLRTGPFRVSHGHAMTVPLRCVPCCSDRCSVPAEGRSESERPFCLTALQPDLVAEEALEHFTAFLR